MIRGPRLLTALVFLAGLTVVSCRIFERDDDVLAVVGETKITRKDADLRDEVIRYYYPGESRKAGLHQLKEAYIQAEVLRRHGHPVTDAVLEAEEKRMDKESLLPQRLAQIRAIFGEDHASFLRVYVLPVYAQRELYYGFFLHDPDCQHEAWLRAHRFVKKAAASPQRFKELATAESLVASPFILTAEQGIQWVNTDPTVPDEIPTTPSQTEAEAFVRGKMDTAQQSAQSEAGTRWVREVVGALKPGQVFTKVVDAGDSYEAVRYLGPERKGGYRLEAVVFPKADFGKWLDQEKARIPIQVNGKE